MKKTLAAIAAIALLGMAPVCAFAEEEAAPVEAPVAEAALEAEEIPLAEDAPVETNTLLGDADAAETTVPADVEDVQTTAVAAPGFTAEQKVVHFTGSDVVAPFDVEVTTSLQGGVVVLHAYVIPASDASDPDFYQTSVTMNVATPADAAAKTIDDYFRISSGTSFTIVSDVDKNGNAFHSENVYSWNGYMLGQPDVPFETTIPAQTNVAPAETTTAAETATTAAAQTTTAAAATDKKDDGKKDEEKKDDDSPDTGDTTSALPLILGAAAALTGAATIVRRKQD